MAQWKETLEPYVKVQEVVKTRALTPTAGQDLIIGCVIISDAGPSNPTLITSQKEFLETYSTITVASELTEDYIESLNNLYTGDDDIASTMWQNAYRLAGSNNLLVVRASKGNNTVFAKTFGDNASRYVLRDGELLKQVFLELKIVNNINLDNAVKISDGFSINVNGIGIIGNRRDDKGVQYDYLANNLPELIDTLNSTSKFFCPIVEYYKDRDGKTTQKADITTSSSNSAKNEVVSAVLKEVYLAPNFLDTTDERCEGGILYLTPCEVDYSIDNANQLVYDLNQETDYEISPYYAVNRYNTATPIKIRIRRFNHDAVVSKELANTGILEKGGPSPYEVLKDVLASFTNNGYKEPSESVLERDFFEVATWDPGVSTTDACFYNVGNISGRGDISVSELNGLFEMIQVSLPEDLHDLGLNYYDYDDDDLTWEKLNEETLTDEDKEIIKTTTVSDYSLIWDSGEAVVKYMKEDNMVYVSTGEESGYYKCVENNDATYWLDLTINTEDNHIISVGDADILAGFDLIELDEVYTTEGLCDLGNTDLTLQKYIATKAINSNYFYPISTINSTNYMTIGNSINKMSSFNSPKLYASAPWDYDTETLGWGCYMSPAVLYWEAVSRNRVNNIEFHGVFGQTGGLVNYQSPVCEFNKKTRQLLLSKKINTVLWNTQTNAWNINDNYTKQTTDTILSDEGNSRLMIRISKAVPSLLKPFIGEKITDKLCEEVHDAIDYYFRAIILPMGVTVDAYQIFCNYDENLAAQNKIKVVINVRYQRSLKYVNVVNNAYDVGMDISSEE